MASEDRTLKAVQQTLRRYTESNLTIDKWLQYCPVYGAVVTAEYVHFIGSKWRRELGWDHKKIELQEFASWVHPDDIGSLATEIEKVRGGEPGAGTLARYRIVPEGWKWMIWVGTTVQTPGGPLIYGAAIDVSGSPIFKDSIESVETKR